MSGLIESLKKSTVTIGAKKKEKKNQALWLRF
jgi:hypothetical protein